MDTPEFILVSIISILLIIIFIFISRGVISAKLGGIIVLITPFLTYFLIVFFWEKGGILNSVCVGLLLSLAFGPATFKLGRLLENRAKEKRNS